MNICKPTVISSEKTPSFAVMIAGVIFIFSVAGCSMKRVAVIETTPLSESYSFKLVDKRETEKAESFATRSGNIYSCQYGTRLLENDEVVPERLKYLAHILNQSGRDILAGKQLTVKRFSLYWNQSVEMRRGALAGMSAGFAGGAIAANVKTAGTIGALVATDLVVSNQAVKSSPKQGALVGCKEDYSGSYWASELNGGIAPFVVYFDLSVNEMPVQIRIVQPMAPPLEQSDYAKYVKLSIERLADALLDTLKLSLR